MHFVTETVSLENIADTDKFLTDREILQYRSFKFEKRRLDWLGGRFCAKKAIAKSFEVDNYKDIEVANDRDRKPYFKIKGVIQDNALSISHCPGYAVSAVATGKNTLLGIDMEIVEKRSGSWVKEFFSPTEMIDTSPLALTVLWTQKEAVLKALGLGLSANLHQLMISGNKPVFSGRLLEVWKDKGAKKINVFSYSKDEQYIVSIAYDL
jgi:4'-phosphopantetheinyl transferase